MSSAFVEKFELPPISSGILDGFTFAVKDLIDIRGYITGCGNPRWKETHAPAVAHAVCVEQLLRHGARCVGKTITDELAYSLMGENHFYGTPLNPKAPDRVPGGSSSGSASAVACGISDFALGTDTGGSVRVPAHNCGIWGIRPTHGLVSVAGVAPLSPTFDTVGILASSAEVLAESAAILLSVSVPDQAHVEKMYLIKEALDAAEPEIASRIAEGANLIAQTMSVKLRKISMREIDHDHSVKDLSNWYEIYRVLQRAEAWSCLGAWITGSGAEFGPMIRESLDLAASVDRNFIPKIVEQREELFRRMKDFLGPRDLLCIPTASSVAPLKGTVHKREQAAKGYYQRTLALTSIAGVARLPQIAMPLANLHGIPTGISIVGAQYQDGFLLSLARRIAACAE